MKGYFQGKTIVITGAASGIGKDLAEVLLEAGGKPILLDIQKVNLPGCPSYQVDVTDLKAMREVAEEILRRNPRVDVVVAAAGVGGINPARNFSLELDRKIMSVNYFGTSNTLIPYVDHMRKNGSGHLVGISSLAAFRGLPNAGSYSASKAAQMTLLESLRLDLKGSGVTVSCIHPGFVATPMAEHDEFDMPFMVSVRKSSELILRAIAGKASQTGYPWQMSLLSRINRLLPNCVYDFLMPRLSPAKESRPKLLSSLKDD